SKLHWPISDCGQRPSNCAGHRVPLFRRRGATETAGSDSQSDDAIGQIESVRSHLFHAAAKASAAEAPQAPSAQGWNNQSRTFSAVDGLRSRIEHEWWIEQRQFLGRWDLNDLSPALQGFARNRWVLHLAVLNPREQNVDLRGQIVQFHCGAESAGAKSQR